MRRTIQIRLAALLSAAALILLCLPVGAASGPTVSAGNAVVTQGGAGTVIISAQGLERLTSLQLEIAYDAQALSVTGAVTKSMDVATADCNTAGTIRYIGISMNGVSGANDLLEITFRANANAAPGSYPIQVFVAGATADKGGGDAHIAVAVRAGTVTVLLHRGRLRIGLFRKFLHRCLHAYSRRDVDRTFPCRDIASSGTSGKQHSCRQRRGKQIFIIHMSSPIPNCFSNQFYSTMKGAFLQ